jgi:hypothetical protein
VVDHTDRDQHRAGENEGSSHVGARDVRRMLPGRRAAADDFHSRGTMESILLISILIFSK